MRNRANNYNLEGISGLVKSVLKELGVYEQVLCRQVLESWDEIVGGIIAAKVQPIGIRDKILFLTPTSREWAKQINSLKEKIIERLNKKAGKIVITDLRFQKREEL